MSNQVVGRLPRTILVIAAAVAVGALGWVGGYATAGLYLALPLLSQRENPALFAALLVIGALGTVGVALLTMMIVERLTKLAGTGRTYWRWGGSLGYLLAAAASAALLLCQHYQFLDQYGR